MSYDELVQQLREYADQYTSTYHHDSLIKNAADAIVALQADLAAARALLLGITSAYNAYRRRGVAPAPTEYEDVVRAITKADAALAGKDQPPSAAQQLGMDLWSGCKP